MTEPDPAPEEAASTAVESVATEPAPEAAAAAESDQLPTAATQLPAIDVTPRASPVTAADHCLNCGAALAGRYCSECGQRAQLKRLSLATLVHDVVHDLVDIDSRLWRTLTALLLRPGRLTNEFISGRRTFYFPPFRLYLVLSLVYFILPSVDHETAAFNVGKDNKVVVADLHSNEGQEAIKQAMQELQQEVGGSKAKVNAPVEPAPPPAPPEPASTGVAKTPATAPDSKPAASANSRLMEGMDCNTLHTDLFSGWLRPRLVQGCRHLQTVTQREFERGLIANIPKMLFVFLPLIAFVNLVLYVFRRRTYVEHLLFYVHFHAFGFLLLTLVFVVAVILGWIGLTGISGLLKFAAGVYLFIYLFKAMRAVYHQGRLMTTLKYAVVLVAYFVCALLTFLGVTAYTAFTV